MVDQEVTGGRNINRGMIVRGPWKIKVITKGQSSKLKIVWEPNSPTAFCETEAVLEGKLMKGRFPSCFYFFHLYLSFSFFFFLLLLFWVAHSEFLHIYVLWCMLKCWMKSTVMEMLCFSYLLLLAKTTNIIYFCLIFQCSDKLGLSLELGLFAAGVMISTTDLDQHTLKQVKHFFVILCLPVDYVCLSNNLWSKIMENSVVIIFV